MKRKSTIRKDKYFLTLLCVLVAISVNAELRTQAVERFNGTTTFSGSALNNVKNGVYSNSTDYLTFEIDNINKYDNSGRLDYPSSNKGETKTSNFKWSAKDSYVVTMKAISCQVRG